MAGTSMKVSVAAMAAMMCLGGCSYAYRNPAEALGPGEVGGRTLAGVELTIDGVAISVQGASLDTSSRQNGRFAMLPLPVGRHVLMFRKGKGRALQREVEIGWGQDGQPQGVWLGDVVVPAAVGLNGQCATANGVGLAENGIAVDEVSGATVPMIGGASGHFSFEGLSVGPHRIRAFATGLDGHPYVGGPVEVTLLPSDGGTDKTLARFTLHAGSVAPPDAGQVKLKFGVAGSIPGLLLSELTVTGLPTAPAFASDGSALVSLPEGLWTLGISLPARLQGVIAPPLKTFVAVKGQVIDLGTLYAVTEKAQGLAALGCHTDADCAPGTCSAGTCVDLHSPPQAPARDPYCAAATAGCTAGTPYGGVLSDATGTLGPPYTSTCVGYGPGAATIAVACGSCCTPDGVLVLCAGVEACPSSSQAGTSTISGVIHGSVAKGVTVALSGTGSATQVTGIDGTFKFADLSPGIYTVTPSLAGYLFAPPSVQLAVSSGSTPFQDFAASTAFSAVASGSGDELTGIWGSSASDLWVVDVASGVVRRGDGTSWTNLGASASPHQGVWGSSASDVWVVDRAGQVEHWNGITWTSETLLVGAVTDNLSAVWGTGPGDVWAVGDGLMGHWDGTAWSTSATRRLLGVWGSSSNDVWAVGRTGTILHFDGAAWSEVTGPTAADLLGVWGASASDVWAVGTGGTIVHWDGSAWALVQSGTSAQLMGVGGTASDVVAVGTDGTILHWDGAAWAAVPSGVTGWLYAVWGSPTGELWVVGSGGTVLRAPGGSIGTGTSSLSGAVGGDASGGVAVSLTGAVSATAVTETGGGFRFTGLPDGRYDVTPSKAGYAFSPATQQVTVARSDVGGVTFTSVATSHAISGTVWLQAGVTLTLSGASSATTTSDVDGAYRFGGLADGSYTVTPSLTGYVFTPASLQIQLTGADVTLQDFASGLATYAIRGTVSGAISEGVSVLLAGYGTTTTDASGAYAFTGLFSGDYTLVASSPGYLFTPDGLVVTVNGADANGRDFTATSTGWAPASGVPTYPSYMSVWGASANDVWVIGGGGALQHWDGTSWVQPSVTGMPASGGFLCVRGTSSTDVWISGTGGTIMHWDGTTWSQSASGNGAAFTAIWPLAPNDVWAVGSDGTILHWNGSSWSRVASGITASLRGVWGSGANDVWAVGDSGTILHFDGAAWSEVTGPTAADLLGVWGASASDVWAVGTGGTIVHWDGSAWALVQSGTSAQLMGVGGTASDVVAVGTDGTILHWDGAAWAAVPSGVTGWLHAVWGSPTGELWVVGQGGTVLRAPGGSIGAGTSSLSGLVSGEVSAGVAVSLAGATSATVVTDAGGSFRFTGLPDGRYDVTPSRLGYAFSPATRQVTVARADVSGVGFTSVATDHAISGTVWLQAGVTLTLSGAASATTTSDVNGAYRFGGLADGSYTVTPSLAGSVFTPASLQVQVAGADVALQDFTSGPASYAIRGTVSGAISAGVSVLLAGYGTTITDASGAYAFTGLVDGDYTLVASAPGYLFTPDGLVVTVNGADATGQDFTATSTGWAPASGLPSFPWYQSVWGASASDVWVIGGGGAIEHWDGTAWTQPSVNGVPGSGGLMSVRGTSSTDVWISGNLGTIMHWDGTTWSQSASGNGAAFTGIWPVAPNDAWAVGSGGTILHWDGATWSPVASGLTASLRGVWGSGPNDVWAVGDSGTILRWDGASWTWMASGTSTMLRAVAGSGPGDVWAIGDAGIRLHWDGTAWTRLGAGSTSGGKGAWVFGPGDAWVACDNGSVEHWDGTSWTNTWLGVHTQLEAVWGSAPGDVWVVGGGGLVLRTGSFGHTISGTVRGPIGAGVTVTLSGPVSATTTTDGAGRYAVAGLPDGGYTVTPSLAGYEFLPASLSPYLAGADAPGQDFGAVIGYAAPIASFIDDFANAEFISGIWGAAQDDVWAVGWRGGTVYHFDGQSWLSWGSPAPTFPTALWGLHGSGATDVWAVGHAGTALHWDGTAWTPVATGVTAPLYSVWVRTPADAWAVGAGGVILRWDGSTWSSVTSPVATDLRSVWGIGPADIWAVGLSTTLIHWDGTTWTALPDPGWMSDLVGVWGRSATDVWTVGNIGGALAHWDGTAWSSIYSSSPGSFTAVWGDASGDTWVLADRWDWGIESTGPALLRWDGSSRFDPIDPGMVSGYTGSLNGFRAIWGRGTDIWVGARYALNLLRRVGVPAPTHTIRGQVQGTQVAGVTVTASGAGSATALTDASGHFELTGLSPGLHAVTPSATGQAFLPVSSTVDLHWADATTGVFTSGPAVWQPVTFPATFPTLYPPLVVGGTGPSNLWVGGPHATASWDGSTWTAQPTNSMQGVSAIWSFSPSDTWVAGYSGPVWHCSNGCADYWPATLNHWDGTAWTAYDQFWGSFNGLWGTSPTDLWAVGGGGGATGLYGIQHWDGTAWSIVAYDMYDQFNSVWGSSPSDVWVVGEGGAILHWDGATWTPFASGVTASLTSVSGASASDVWAVGHLGTMIHWDGTAWRTWANTLTPPLVTLVSISFGGPGDAWALASDGSTIHWDGANWSLLPSGLVSGISVHGAGGGFWLTDGVGWLGDGRLYEYVRPGP